MPTVLLSCILIIVGGYSHRSQGAPSTGTDSGSSAPDSGSSSGGSTDSSGGNSGSDSGNSGSGSSGGDGEDIGWTDDIL